MAIFNSKLLVYQRVPEGVGGSCGDNYDSTISWLL